MIRTIEVETNDNFESCDDCVHSEIWKEINRLKAIAEYQNFLSRISYEDRTIIKLWKEVEQ